jgi:hypothetical protein
MQKENNEKSKNNGELEKESNIFEEKIYIKKTSDILYDDLDISKKSRLGYGSTSSVLLVKHNKTRYALKVLI